MSSEGACRKVRAGLGGAFACATHGRPWPCRVRDQAVEQLTLLHEAAPLAPRVLLEVAAERVHQLARFPAGTDDTKTAPEWVALIVEYLNRANTEGRLLAQREAEGGALDPAEWRRRLVQVAAIALAGVEWCDRVLGAPVGD